MTLERRPLCPQCWGFIAQLGGRVVRSTVRLSEERTAWGWLKCGRSLTGEFESKGFVTSLDLVASSFSLSRIAGGTSFITVNFSSGQLPTGTANNSLVEVKKSLTAPSGGAITASLIRLEDKLGASGEMVEAEGIISNCTVADFVINGQQVVTDTSTVYEGGLSADFAVGVKLEAEGPLNSSGAIVASKITFRSTIKIEGDASAVSATGTGLTVLGQTVVINQLTRLDNGRQPHRSKGKTRS